MISRAGAQARLFRFGAARSSSSRATLQGSSAAGWEDGGLKSERATLTEYFDLMPPQPNGDRWLVVSALRAPGRA